MAKVTFPKSTGSRTVRGFAVPDKPTDPHNIRVLIRTENGREHPFVFDANSIREIRNLLDNMLMVAQGTPHGKLTHICVPDAIETVIHRTEGVKMIVHEGTTEMVVPITSALVKDLAKALGMVERGEFPSSTIN